MPKRPPETIESLERKIAVGRQKLYEVYTAHGCRTDSTVLACSVRLDKLINQRQARINGINNPD